MTVIGPVDLTTVGDPPPDEMLTPPCAVMLVVPVVLIVVLPVLVMVAEAVNEPSFLILSADNVTGE